MDVEKLFKNVRNLNQYINVTEDVCRKFKNHKIQFNMSTVLSLKKVRSLEVEYFNKCDGNGAAFNIIERMLELPPSKTWGLLGKELISLVQYWLDATRKHLISHSPRWWLFLDFLLKFMKVIRSKDSALPDLLVEGTTERLLDLATKRQPDVLQRLAILSCINSCCAGSTRKIRFALRHHFDNYFIKLSSILATSGDFLTQHSILETLIHWLLPRQNLAVRHAAAAKWFPNNLYRKNTVDVFLQREWKNFYQDARDFLNAHNEVNELIVSANCRKVTIGEVVALSSIQDRNVWMDVNSSSKSISILMHPHMLDALGINDITCFNYLVITEDNVQTAQLCRQSIDVKLTMKLLNDLLLYPSANSVSASEVCVEVSSRIDLRRLDHALRNVLDGKYQVLLDFEDVPPSSPCNASRTVCETPDEDTRLSHPVQVTRRKHSGYMVRSKATHFKSPSSTSTTSLALLHDRLAALPKFKFDKEPVRVSLLPKLSNVSELTEVEDKHTFASCSTKKLRPYGVCYKGIANTVKKQEPAREYSSPVPNELSTSCLLVATIGSDESVINDTLERLSKNKNCTNDNVVDLLVQEAFQSKENELCDSGIKTGDNNKTQGISDDSENIESTPNLEEHVSSEQRPKTHNITSDDSNEIKETPYEFVNVRKRILVNKHKEKEELDKAIGVNKLVYAEEAIEQFFSQHIVEDKQNGINVSPTLARKINETSSESDESHNDLVPNEDYLNVDDILDSDVINCLNSILDKVCIDFDKCTDLLNRDNTEIHTMDTVDTDAESIDNEVAVSNIENIDTVEKRSEIAPKKRVTQKGNIKLKFNTKNDRLNKNRSRKLKSKFNVASTKPMSPILELKNSVEPDINIMTPVHIEGEEETVSQLKDNTVDVDADACLKNKVNSPEINNINVSPESVNSDTPLARTKRKLYSAKNKHIENQQEFIHISGIKRESKSIKILHEVVSSKNKVKTPEIKIINVSPRSDNSDTPLIVRRKRKLYSPKDEQIENDKENVQVSDTTNDDTSKSKTDSLIRSPKFTATCYKDIEKERKKNIRQPRIRITRPKGKYEIPSPRSKKMNDLFDTLKENVDRNQNIILADQKFADQGLAIYNFTSDSEDDEDFKMKKMEVKKRISMRLSGDGPIVSARQTRRNRLYHNEETRNKVVKKSVKKSKKYNTRKRSTQLKSFNLADERMREAPKEELNTSMILEKTDKVDKEPVPVMKAVPQMEVIIDDDYDELKKPTTHSKNIRNKKIKTNVAQLSKKVKTQKLKIIANEKTDNDDRTISPLPELVVENVKHIQDPNDSMSSQMIMKKLEESYKVGPDYVDEPNTTQKLLDVDSVDLNSHEVDKNTSTVKLKPKDAKPKRKIKIIKEHIKDDIIETYSIIEIEQKESKTQKSDKNSITVNISSNSGGKSEKSINTVGKSPITAHGDMNEAPPDFELLNEIVKPRNLELENLDPSLKDYFLKLRDDINDLPAASKKMSIKSKQPYVVLEKIDIIKTEDATLKSPTVSIPRLSHEDIRQWLPSRRNSKSESSNSEKDFKPKTLRVSGSHITLNSTETPVKNTKKLKTKSSSHSNTNKTTTKAYKEEKHKQKRLKKNTSSNNANSKTKDKKMSVLHKNDSNDSSEEDSDLVSRILQLHNIDSKTHVNTQKEKPSHSDDSTISSIRFDDFEPISTPYNEERSANSNNLKVKNNISSNEKIKAFKPPSNNIDNLDRSIRFDNTETIKTRHNDEKDTKDSAIANNPLARKNNIIFRNEKNKSFKAKTHKDNNRPSNNTNNLVLSSIRFDNIEPINIIHNKEKDENISRVKKNKREHSNDKGKALETKARTILSEANDFDNSLISPTKCDDNEMSNKQQKTSEVSYDKGKESTKENNSSGQDIKRNNRKRSLSLSSNRSKLSIRKDNSKTSVKSILKRKSESPMSELEKRRKPEMVLSDSGPSASSVNDWFRKNVALSTAESISQTYTDTLQNVMEKLDTTLAEIHQNTSKKFIHLFVEVQRQLTELRTQKLGMYKQATADILTEVTAILEVKYADLEIRSQQMDSEFTQHLKHLSSELIKEDFTQKCAMVVLLKEDLQAVADHLAKKRES